MLVDAITWDTKVHVSAVSDGITIWSPVHIPYMINIYVLRCLFYFTAQFFKAQRDTRPPWLITGLARLHRLVNMAQPPHFERQEERTTAGIKRVLTFNWHRAVSAAVTNEGTVSEGTQWDTGGMVVVITEFNDYHCV